MNKEINAVLGDALIVFRKMKVATIDEIAVLLGASQKTARRRLREWKVYRSYNGNGRYYALPEVAKFDTNGLWRHNGIGFSKHGNLSETVVHLVVTSDAGLYGAKLGEILNMDPRTFLSPFGEHPALRREKHQGRFVYFSAEEDVYCRQVDVCKCRLREKEFPSDTEAVAILVTVIKHPELDVLQLCRKIESEGVNTNLHRITNLLAKHDLTLKKTPLSPS